MKKCIFGFGRMNPPTIGHEKLAMKMKDIARRADVRLYLSHTQNKKKDPLDYNTKYEIARKAFGSLVYKSNARTIIEVLKDLESSGYTDITMVAGSDRLKSFQDLLAKYNGKEYNFNSIKVVSAGVRDPDADGAEGMSASKLRQLAKEGEYEQFVQGLPKGAVRKDAKKIYDKLRSIMEEEDKQLDEARMGPFMKKMNIQKGDTVEVNLTASGPIGKSGRYKLKVKSVGKQFITLELPNNRTAKFRIKDGSAVDIDAQIVGKINESTELDEAVLTVQQRQKRSRMMKRIAKKVQRMRAIRMKRMADTAHLEKRARKKAIQFLRKKVAGERGAHYNDLGYSEKMTVDKLVAKRASSIDKLARKLLPKVRRSELERLKSLNKNEEAIVKKADNSDFTYETLAEHYNNAIMEYDYEKNGTPEQQAFQAVNTLIANGALQEEAKPMKKFKDVCWKGYEPVGTKMKDGKEVPNCVPKSESADNGVDYVMRNGRPTTVMQEPDQSDDAPQTMTPDQQKKQKQTANRIKKPPVTVKEGTTRADMPSASAMTFTKKFGPVVQTPNPQKKKPANYSPNPDGQDITHVKGKPTMRYTTMGFEPEGETIEEGPLVMTRNNAVKTLARIADDQVNKMDDKQLMTFARMLGKTINKQATGKYVVEEEEVEESISPKMKKKLKKAADDLQKGMEKTYGKHTVQGVQKANREMLGVKKEDVAEGKVDDVVDKLSDYVLRTTGLGTTNAKGEKIVYTDKEPSKEKKEVKEAVSPEKSKKMLKDILPKAGAGQEGTDELANNYKKATPGQLGEAYAPTAADLGIKAEGAFAYHPSVEEFVEQYEDWGEVQEEAEHEGRKVQLNNPFRTPNGPKKFSVYVKNDKGNVVKVNFGDPNMEIKRDDPERRKAYRSRHGCDNPGPKWKANYWSCYQWRAGSKVDN